MTCTITKGYQCVLKVPGTKMETRLFAPTLEELDLEVKAHLESIRENELKRARAPIARRLGTAEKNYKRARAALCGG